MKLEPVQRSILLVGQAASIYERLQAEGFETQFQKQPDITIIKYLHSFRLLKFSAPDLGSAIQELYSLGIKDYEKIKQELQKRIDYNNLRRKNVDGYRAEDIKFTGKFLGNDRRWIEATSIESIIRKQFDDDILRKASIGNISFGAVIDNNGTYEPYNSEEPPNGYNCIHQAEYIGSIAGKDALLSETEPLRILRVYTKDESPVAQNHLDPHDKQIELKRVTGYVVHEFAHSVQTWWDQKIYDEWLSLLKAEESLPNRLTQYLDLHGDETARFRVEATLNHKEEWAETLKVFCTNVDYLQQYSPERVKFIRKYYPGIKDSSLYQQLV